MNSPVTTLENSSDPTLHAYLGDHASDKDPDERQRPGRGASMKQALRQVRPERSSSRGRSHVEKSIEVTLPVADQVTNVRSRKSSHYMGLFRENTTPIMETELGTTRFLTGHPRPGRSPSSVPRPLSPEAGRAHLEQKGQSAIENVEARPGPFQEAENLEQVPSEELTTSPLPSPTSVSPHGFQISSPSQVGHDPYFRTQDEIRQQLFEQIRQRRPDKSGSHEIPFIPYRDIQSHDGGRTLESDSIPARERTDLEREEHMSKVEYKPHAGRPPEEIERLSSIPISYPEDDERDEKAPPKVIRDLSESRWATGEISAPEHIDISIESKHEKKIFHGSYQPPEDDDEDYERSTEQLSPVSEYPDTKVSSASETEAESGDDEMLVGPTDEGELTPTGTTGRQLTLRPRRKSKSNEPKAVVLDPYSHQVGGHSTMFRFSRRAVCKRLNNRENQFYERVEVRHPDLLRFLPR